MSNYITIDGGTSNTRVSLVVDNKVVDTVRFHVGAKNSIEDKAPLKNTIKCGIAEVLAKNNLQESDITRILASGMITSEYGLIALDHIVAPVGINELHQNMYETVIDSISIIPFVFVRGVKTCSDLLQNTDMMRGEETELMGIMQGEGTYILSGSHSKIIEVNSLGQIVDFRTMLTGEMIAALSENTILKSAIELNKQTVNREFLLVGYEYAKQFGINNALFKVRVLKNICNRNANEIYSFFMGIVLCDEVQYILSRKPDKIIITGQPQIKEAVGELISQLTSAPLILMSEEEVNDSTAVGMIKIFEHK